MRKTNKLKKEAPDGGGKSFQADILFLYENVKANPNGDPYENKPRIDPWTGRCLVSDVRIKRTIRDFWKKNQSDIFIIREEFGEAKTAGNRLKEKYSDLNKFLKNADHAKKTICRDFIDVRLFGVTIPIRDKSKGKEDNKREADEKEKSRKALTVTGPAQFQYAESLHPVEHFEDRGTSAFASVEERRGKKVGQGTFRASYYVPYALIAVDGTVNATASKETGVNDDDIEQLYKGLWQGTLQLSSRSKNQKPVALVVVHYSDKEFRIGTLSRFLKVAEGRSVKDWSTTRGVKDADLDWKGLYTALSKESKRIEKVDYLFTEDWQPPKNGLWKEIRFTNR